MKKHRPNLWGKGQRGLHRLRGRESVLIRGEIQKLIRVLRIHARSTGRRPIVDASRPTDPQDLQACAAQIRKLQAELRVLYVELHALRAAVRSSERCGEETSPVGHARPADTAERTGVAAGTMVIHLPGPDHWTATFTAGGDS